MQYRVNEFLFSSSFVGSSFGTSMTSRHIKRVSESGRLNSTFYLHHLLLLAQSFPVP